MKVGILGYGFVGRAVALLSSCHEVSIYDPNIDEFGSADQKDSAYNADFIIVCVPTPQSDSGELDISIVQDIAEQWAARKALGILVIKSTIPVGTIDALCEKHNTYKIVHNPEFLSQRTALADFASTSEVIVGHRDTCSGLMAACHVHDMYKEYYAAVRHISVTAKQAEMVKIARNSLYATKIVFMNEVYDLCQELGVDYDDRFLAAFTSEGQHLWIGPQHSSVPGPDGLRWFGGKCLRKDSKGLLSVANNKGADMSVLRAAVEKNDFKRMD